MAQAAAYTLSVSESYCNTNSILYFHVIYYYHSDFDGQRKPWRVFEHHIILKQFIICGSVKCVMIIYNMNMLIIYIISI